MTVGYGYKTRIHVYATKGIQSLNYRVKRVPKDTDLLANKMSHFLCNSLAVAALVPVNESHH